MLIHSTHNLENAQHWKKYILLNSVFSDKRIKKHINNAAFILQEVILI